MSIIAIFQAHVATG